ncbi:hypothetical protein [Streptomyces sp. NPDC126514]|uniref:hypothetical protein n=1 Tax=Streptomyces sp. NPDC126514 TaxID=3155210 RepID=UPI00332A9138
MDKGTTESIENRLRLAALRLEAGQVERDAAVRWASEAGLSRRAVASAVGLTASRVQQIVAAQPDPSEVQEQQQRIRRELKEIPEGTLRSTTWDLYGDNAAEQLGLRIQTGTIREHLQRITWRIRDLRRELDKLRTWSRFGPELSDAAMDISRRMGEMQDDLTRALDHPEASAKVQASYWTL